MYVILSVKQWQHSRVVLSPSVKSATLGKACKHHRNKQRCIGTLPRNGNSNEKENGK